MDPNETLRRIRELAEAITYAETSNAWGCAELAELVLDLDNWMSYAGSPPDAWTERREYSDRW